MSESDNVRAQKNETRKKQEISKEKNEFSRKMQSQKKKWNLKKNQISKKIKSEKKWIQKISEHSQCQCHIMLESS